MKKKKVKCDKLPVCRSVSKFEGVVIVVIIVAIIVFLRMLMNGGILFEHKLTAEIFNDNNPARVQLAVRKCNTVTGTVIDINSFGDIMLDLGEDGFNGVQCRVHTSEKTAAGLDVGDYVKATGKLHYTYPPNSTEHWVSFGDALGCPPLAYRANVILLK